MRKRIKTIQVNGQFKKVETRTATKAVWQQEITCVKVTSQTVAGAEKSRKYLRVNAEKAQKALERKEQEMRRKEFYKAWEERHRAELFRDADKNLSYVH